MGPGRFPGRQAWRAGAQLGERGQRSAAYLGTVHLVEPSETAGRAAQRRRPSRAERRLAARLRRRDRSALAELYAAYGRMTFGLLLDVRGDRGAAEDVQQQVFLQVWQQGAAYDPRRASPGTWVMTIARSRALDHRRRRVPEPRDPHLEAERAAGVDDASVRELHDAWAFAATVEGLPPEEAELLRLRFADGLSQAEIAVALGLPLGTVKSRMARSLTRLRATIEEDR